MKCRPGKFKRFVTACGLAVMLSSASPTSAQEPVSIELILGVDTSISVSGFEFQLQMQGMADTFRDPTIVSAIEAHPGGVAIALFQWSGTPNTNYVLGWHRLHNAASVHAFAAEIEHADRDPGQGFTALGRAIDFAASQLLSNRFAGEKLKIDISGDGRSNKDILPEHARQNAQEQDITVNGLPILTDVKDLDDYFRKWVITGPGAFVEVASDYRSFADAFKRKLLRELSPLITQVDRPIRAATLQ